MVSISITATGITVTGSVVGTGSVTVSYKRGTRRPTVVTIKGNGA